MNCCDSKLDGNILIVAKHPERTSIKSEAQKIVDLNLETNENVQRMLDMQDKNNFKDDVGLSETALLIP
jgi:hypothetical protein